MEKGWCIILCASVVLDNSILTWSLFCFRCNWSFVFDPAGRLCYYWSMVVSFAFLYNFWVIIFRFSFAEITLDSLLIWFSLDYLMDLIYLFDIGKFNKHCAHWFRLKSSRSEGRKKSEQDCFNVDQCAVWTSNYHKMFGSSTNTQNLQKTFAVMFQFSE